eukprot:TRINITY_DN5814_c0_g2_i4.p1 TRINITY_DN5814_c0_g2~~TRINITY_DN5814_c0_g2_i4.p1  ORF type:complete len:562 (+),score=103.55 TRINITY_DN5814_c0_g2_i4:660-2345(+)
MGVAQETGFAKKLWVKYENEAFLALYNPFVVALGAGTLNRDSFRHYVAQDSFFLKAFIQAYTLAEDCADDDDDKASISELRMAAEKEFNMHTCSAEAWGIEFGKDEHPNMATIKYTEFLLSTAAGKIEGGMGLSRSVTPFEKTKLAAYTVGAMTPCMRLYAFLAQEIAKIWKQDIDGHPYQQWIEMYSSAKFEASASQIEELLDKLAISLTGEELEVLERLYNHAMKLELEFFSAQPLSQRTVVPLLVLESSANHHYIIASDFDLSCTVVDSSVILAELSILTSRKAEQNHAENFTECKPSSDLRKTWDTLSSQYCHEYEDCLKKSLPPEKENTFNYKGLLGCLEQISQFEVEANSKVVESGVLRGIDINGIKKAGERLVLQDGCANLFKQIQTRTDRANLDMHIISVCWSGDIIRAAFSANAVDGLTIHSNELIFQDSVSTGDIDRHVETPVDKLKVFDNILGSLHEHGKCHTSVYVGDSLGDLLCLLRADVGILIGSSSSNIRRVGKHFGVSFVPLHSAILKHEKTCQGGSGSWTKESGVLYTVSRWSEIHAFLLGFSS